VNSDRSVRELKGEGRPVNGESDRGQVLAALASVDAVVVFDESTPIDIIRKLKPDVLTKGGDYTIDGVLGAREVRDAGGRVVILPFVAGFSTTTTLTRIAVAKGGVVPRSS
jgi:D-beta-D-heptose 7-phosphate kinase/D-beta-D-heptose 1-phosphate adenosyltransferase